MTAPTNAPQGYALLTDLPLGVMNDRFLAGRRSLLVLYRGKWCPAEWRARVTRRQRTMLDVDVRLGDGPRGIVGTKVRRDRVAVPPVRSGGCLCDDGCISAYDSQPCDCFCDGDVDGKHHYDYLEAVPPPPRRRCDRCKRPGCRLCIAA